MPEKTPTTKKGLRARFLLPLLYALPVVFVLGLCGYMAYGRLSHQGPPVRKISAAPFATVKIQGLDERLEAQLFAQGNALRAAGNDLFIEFRGEKGKLADVGEVSFMLALRMPNSVMHSIGKVMRTATPGQYRTTLDPGLAGEWTATLRFSGPRGQAEAVFSVQVL
jgi:hypothetical protein